MLAAAQAGEDPSSPGQWARFFGLMPTIPVGLAAGHLGEWLERPARAVHEEIMRSAE